MTIFKDGKETEKVTLSDYDDKAKLHELFAAKGFVKDTSRRNMRGTADTTKQKPQQLSPRKERKDKLRQLRQARENYMVVGMPRG